MKIKSILAALLLLPLAGCLTYAAPRIPINNGILQTDLNANGKAITNQDSTTHSFSWGSGNSTTGLVQGTANLLSGYQNAAGTTSFGSGNSLSGFQNAYLSGDIGSGVILHGYQNAYSGISVAYGNVLEGYRNAYAATSIGIANSLHGYQNANAATTLIDGNSLHGYRNANAATSIGSGNVLEGVQNAAAASSLGSANVLLGYRNAYLATTLGEGNVMLGLCSESPFSANPTGNLQIGSLLFATGLNTVSSAKYGPSGGKLGVNTTNLIGTLNVGGNAQIEGKLTALLVAGSYGSMGMATGEVTTAASIGPSYFTNFHYVKSSGSVGILSNTWFVVTNAGDYMISYGSGLKAGNSDTLSLVLYTNGVRFSEMALDAIMGNPALYETDFKEIAITLPANCKLNLVSTNSTASAQLYKNTCFNVKGAN